MQRYITVKLLESKNKEKKMKAVTVTVEKMKAAGNLTYRGKTI